MNSPVPSREIRPHFRLRRICGGEFEFGVKHDSFSLESVRKPKVENGDSERVSGARWNGKGCIAYLVHDVRIWWVGEHEIRMDGATDHVQSQFPSAGVLKRAKIMKALFDRRIGIGAHATDVVQAEEGRIKLRRKVKCADVVGNTGGGGDPGRTRRRPEGTAAARGARFSYV
jgi:hypothetical protein